MHDLAADHEACRATDREACCSPLGPVPRQRAPTMDRMMSIEVSLLLLLAVHAVQAFSKRSLHFAVIRDGYQRNGDRLGTSAGRHADYVAKLSPYTHLQYITCGH